MPASRNRSEAARIASSVFGATESSRFRTLGQDGRGFSRRTIWRGIARSAYAGVCELPRVILRIDANEGSVARNLRAYDDRAPMTKRPRGMSLAEARLAGIVPPEGYRP